MKLTPSRVLSFVYLALVPFATAPSSIATLASSDSAVSQTSNWERYKLDDDEMSVALPTLPAMSSYRVSGAFASHSLIRHVIGAYADGVAYVIYVYQRKESLDDFIANNRPASGDFVRDVEVSGARGKAYGFSNDARHGSTYFLATNSRIYVFEAQGSGLVNPDIPISKFLESIKFGENPDGRTLVDGPGSQPRSQVLSAADEPVRSRDGAVKVVVVSKPEPTYTQDARQHQVTGTIVLRCVFRLSGEVTDIAPMSTLEHGLTEKAIAAAKQIRFIPAIKDGKFVSTYMQLEYNFNLY